MQVILAEKPSVGREIAALIGATTRRDGYLEGNGYAVTWAIGHLVQLAMPEHYGYKGFERVHLPILPEEFILIPRQVKNGKKYNSDTGVLAQLQVIEKLFDACESIIVATDAGREGELIFRYIYHYLECTKPFQRLWISSLTEKAILQGFQNLKAGSDFDSLYEAAKKRSEADWLVGINASQALSLAVGSGIYSLGRVQTPTLAMLCERYIAHSEYQKRPYWQVQLVHQVGLVAFKSLSAGHFDSQKEADNLLKAIERHPQAEVTEVSTKTVEEQPPLLFDLTALQKEANKKYNFSAEQTLQIAQRLYEKKLITYPRTGSKYISADVWEEIPALIRLLQESEEFADRAKHLNLKQLNKRSVNDLKVTDHHALLITDHLAVGLTTEEHSIYTMIANRLLEAVSTSCLKELQTLCIEAYYQPFQTKGTVIKQAGWRAVQGIFSDDKETVYELPKIPQGSQLRVKTAELLSKTTQPPALFTEASLLSAMETAGKDLEDKEQRALLKDSGLGTPATRAAIIETLLKRNYIERKGKALIPTDKGLEVYEWVKHQKIADVALTAEWETALQNIEQGKLSPETFLSEMKSYTAKITTDFLAMDIQKEKAPELCCPRCKHQQLIIQEKVVKCPDPDCGFILFRSVCGKLLSLEHITTLIQEGKTPLIKGLKSKAGKTFDAYIALDTEQKTVFEFPPKTGKRFN